ncbi:MBL fold metallo-hydrolase [Pelomonas sp. CA6]|uniref:MBL fold metallo-hydrolase RNA specificity domain-containing protein n=1 Tax=Pelomonas sp. CA6 TaxID=2907999 RepID=UPI001F4BEBB8|nr:MBL fold metallo-hydrolase [Pelomonas sp. CA6]MCH7344209.1 MBL fold metallo-hydrolase [Pelomonas sp. CA6]
MKIQFLGAADTVTGSRHLVSSDDGRQLLLDCGLFQGYKALRERNWAPFPVPAASLDAVLLSHAHLDHSGYLPALVSQGFKGPIVTSAATRDLCEVLLMDSAHLQEEDARRANRQGSSRHDKALPLYTRRDVDKTLRQFVVPRDGRWRMGETEAQFSPVGHLLGACAITLRSGGRSLVFSGDLGRQHDLLMPPPQRLAEADVLLIESTYGNRNHPAEDVQQRLAQLLRETLARGGSLLLPSFAVGRAQALLLLLQRLRRSGELPMSVPILLDSPMAREATAILQQHRRLLSISAAEAATLCDEVRLISKPADSLRNARLAAKRPCVVISASGMATGGRVLNYIETLAPEARHHIVFPGFQVGGSRGAKMVAGEREVKLHGRYIPVNAQVSHLQSISGHADQHELMQWMRGFQRAPQQVFVVHGEPAASDALRSRIQDELGWAVRVPQQGETVAL